MYFHFNRISSLIFLARGVTQSGAFENLPQKAKKGAISLSLIATCLVVGKLTYDISLAYFEWKNMGGQFVNSQFTLSDAALVCLLFCFASSFSFHCLDFFVVSFARCKRGIAATTNTRTSWTRT
jgi:hypothetical protein